MAFLGLLHSICRLRAIETIGREREGLTVPFEVNLMYCANQEYSIID
jgi:hypothetical protein